MGPNDFSRDNCFYRTLNTYNINVPLKQRLVSLLSGLNAQRVL